ncbi:hypothetical protein OROGR_020662 [Orobanche gracilis]
MKRTTYFSSVLELPDLWPIRKALTLSDVDITHPFLTLPRQHVETHIVVYMSPQQQEHLRAEGQVCLNAQDDDTGDMYIMKLKWRGSYYNLIGKWGKIIRGKDLNVGQEIRLRWFNGCLYFSISENHTIGPSPQALPVSTVWMIAAPSVHDHWPIRKVLTSSDVDLTHPFLPLARKSFDEHILSHWGPQEREIEKGRAPVYKRAGLRHGRHPWNETQMARELLQPSREMGEYNSTERAWCRTRD